MRCYTGCDHIKLPGYRCWSLRCRCVGVDQQLKRELLVWLCSNAFAKTNSGKKLQKNSFLLFFARMDKLNCFIASAFGRKEIDDIYDKIIKKTLKELKVNPLRVDRVNHNDKIDLKILDLIKSCDFGIADLTYARPSVYFESGLLEGRGKQVIYVCRSDHFTPKADDTHGNNKIHFDLITKNIISWKNSSKSFEKRLKARIRLVIAPLQLQLNKSWAETISQREFAKLSIKERIVQVNSRVEKFLTLRKFKKVYLKNYFQQVFKKGETVAKLETHRSISQSELHQVAYIGRSQLSEAKSIILVLCIIGTLPEKRVLNILPSYRPYSKNIYKNNNSTLVVIESITSMYNLESKLKNIQF